MGTSKHLGPPAIQLEALQIWIHGYQFPEATDAWDSNWLWVTARCASSGATVEVTGAILDTVSVLRFQRELTSVHERLQGLATLESHEPELRVEVKAVGAAGHVEVQVDITPDHMNQQHRFAFVVDQSYLPNVIQACVEVLRLYAVRSPAARGA